MKEIFLTQGMVALIDDQDEIIVSPYRWTYMKSSRSQSGYAITKFYKDGVRITLLMHRLISGAKDGDVCDHINTNGLDNRRENLRICSVSQNGMNRGKTRANTSGYKGVSLYWQTGQWRADITFSKKRVFLGVFNSKEEAFEAYKKASKEYHKEYSRF